MPVILFVTVKRADSLLPFTFGISKGWIIGESPLDDSEPVLVCSNEGERRLLEMYRSLNPIGKKRALQDLEDLAQIDRYKKVSDSDRDAV